jgi:hypothetical protein
MQKIVEFQASEGLILSSMYCLSSETRCRFQSADAFKQSKIRAVSNWRMI